MAAPGRPPRRAVQNIVIDIGSSPEPMPRGRTRSASRTRAIAAQASMKGKGKGKGKASSQSNNVVSKRALDPVIELTDSESEQSPVMQNNNDERKRQEEQVQAGPSLPKPFPMLHIESSNSPLLTTVPARASLENIPVASGSSSSKKRKAPAAEPLFLPTQSDEENEPPFMNANPGPTQKKANLGEQGIDLLPIGDDWDQEMQPHLLQYYHDRSRQPAVAPAADLPVPEPPAVPNLQQPLAPVPNVQPTPIPEVQPVIPVEPEPQPEENPTSHAIAQILEIIPDVEPDYLLSLVNTHLPNFGAQTPEHILGLLFEDNGYPRVDKHKGKRKAVDDANIEGDGSNGDGQPNKRVKVDYTSVDRPYTGGPVYDELALVQLQNSFPFIPKPYLRRCLQQNRGFYAPTHLAIAAMEKRYQDVPMGPRPYIMKSTRYNPSKDVRKYRAVVDEALAEERHWLIDHLQDPNETNALVVGVPNVEPTGKGKERAIETEEDEPLEDGTGIECQCCFSEYAFDKMVQCPETHLFCSSCVSQYAATKLGEHDPSIVCMHASGCAQPFTASELRRVLSPKLMGLYERVKQQKEIQEASLEGLEECPFCEWKCVIEASVEEEKLFRCGNEEGGCGEVSCRLCKKKDHLPKSCKEVEEDKLLDGRHAIEEAMTRALMRNCPKCHKAFVKEAGCNKMTCPNCRTLSCYICRKVISGYDHFDQRPGRLTTSRSGGKCSLWDNVEERHATEVKAAAEKAAADYKRDHPDVDDKDIKVDIPVAPKPAPQAAPLLNQQMFAPGLHIGWQQPQVQPIFGLPMQPALLQRLYPPPHPLPPVGQRRHTRAQQQQLLRAEAQQRHLEQQRQLEQQRLDLQAARDRFAQQEQQRQRERERERQEAVHLENQRYYNEIYHQQRIRLEQEHLDHERRRAQQIRQHLDAQAERQRVAHQEALQRHLAVHGERLAAQEATRQRLLEDALRRHNEERAMQVHGHAGRVVRAVDAIPAVPPVRGAVGGRRARRG